MYQRPVVLTAHRTEKAEVVNQNLDWLRKHYTDAFIELYEEAAAEDLTVKDLTVTIQVDARGEKP